MAMSKLNGSSPHKRKYEAESMIAYTLNVSEPLRNKRNTMNYLTMTLQTSPTKGTRALLYSPQKKKLFLQSQETKTAIKIKDFTRTEDNKIVINDMTYVDIATPSEYSFQFNKEITIDNDEYSTIMDILNRKREWETVAVKAKLISVEESKLVGSKGLKLTVANIQDATAAIPFDVWDKYIDDLKVGQVYHFAPLQVRIWNSKKKLSTTRATKISPIQDEDLDAIVCDETCHESSHTDVNITLNVEKIKRVLKFDKFFRCPDCHKRIASSCHSTVKCQQCGTMPLEDCENGFIANILLIDNDDNKVTLKMGDEVLEPVIEDCINMDEQALAEQLFALKPSSLTYNKETLMVKELCV